MLKGYLSMLNELKKGFNKGEVEIEPISPRGKLNSTEIHKKGLLEASRPTSLFETKYLKSYTIHLSYSIEEKRYFKN